MKLFEKLGLKKKLQEPARTDASEVKPDSDSTTAQEQSANHIEEQEEVHFSASDTARTDTTDTVWISPEQAAKILSGDQPLDENILLSEPAVSPQSSRTDADDPETPAEKMTEDDAVHVQGTEFTDAQGTETAEPQETDAADAQETVADNPQETETADSQESETADPKESETADSQETDAADPQETDAADAQKTDTALTTDQEASESGTDEAAEDMPEEDEIVYHRNPRRGRKNKVMGKVIFSVLVLLIIAYLGGRYFFQNHFFPNTYVDGTDLGLHSMDKAREIMTSRLQAETLEIIESDENEYLTGKTVGLHYVNFDKAEDALKNQDSANWFLLLGNHTDYGSLDVDIDPEKLSAALDELHCMNPDAPVKPENAKIYYNPEKHKYMIQEETYGNIINREAFLQAVKDAFISRSSTLSLQDQTYFVQADIKKDNEALQAAKNTMNTWLKGIVKYKDGDLKLKLTRDEISGFIECSDDFKVSINKKLVRKYVEDKVVKTFNSLEGDIPKGLTAWKVHVKKETKALIKDIKGGEKVTRTPVYASQGLAEGEYNLGSTYIDVNIPNQEMWYVENGKVVFNSDVVTGNISTGHGTSTGIFHIQYKQRDHMMVKYHSFVHYWMPYNTTVGIGFHDANWRSSFGGQIYRTDGSHGCINMPPAKAEELYYMISAGTVVYVHE